MNNKITEPAQQISEIRDIMIKSSRFISLSGLSGISAGFFAILGAMAAVFLLGYRIPGFSDPSAIAPYNYREVLLIVIPDAVITAILAVLSAIFFTVRNARKKGLKAWDSTSRRLLLNLFIPLTSGGILSIALLYYRLAFLVPPVTLIFYGLSLVNASKYTLGEIRFLGLLQILAGSAALFLPGHNVLFWAAGFGILHILYGSYMLYKYELAKR